MVRACQCHLKVRCGQYPLQALKKANVTALCDEKRRRFGEAPFHRALQAEAFFLKYKSRRPKKAQPTLCSCLYLFRGQPYYERDTEPKTPFM